jgi:hypothetical protein
MQPTGLCVLHWRPSQGSEGDPPSSDIRLGGGEHSADPALEVARPVASAFPWTTSASGVEIGLLDGSRNSWRSVRPCDGGAASSGSGDEGRRQVYSAQNLRCAAHGSSDLGRQIGDDGGPAPLRIGGEWVWSMISGGIRRRRQHLVEWQWRHVKRQC